MAKKKVPSRSSGGRSTKRPSKGKRGATPRIPAKKSKKQKDPAIDRGWLRFNRDQRAVGGLLEALLDAARREGYEAFLRIAFAPATSEMVRRANATDKPLLRGQTDYRPVWAAIGRFTFRPGIGYADLYNALTSWEKPKLMERVGHDRLSRMRVRYGRDKKGEALDYTLASIGPWVLVVAEAKNQCDPDNDEERFGPGMYGSLAHRYEDTIVEHVEVWFAYNASKDRAARKRADKIHLKGKR